MTEKVKIVKGFKKYTTTKDTFTKKINKKTAKKSLKKEFDNLKYLKNKDLKANIDVPEPIYFSEEKIELKTKLVKGKNLRDIKNPKTYENFGKELKILHEKDEITHGELEVQDVIKKDDEFIMVDLYNLNNKEPLEDYSRFKISLLILQLKQPWNWFKIRNCRKAFTKGYKPKNSKKYLKREVNKIIKSNYKRNFKQKLKAFIINIFVKPRVYFFKK